MMEARPLYQQVLGNAIWQTLPPELRAIHTVEGQQLLAGTATVVTGTSLLSRGLQRLFRMPRDQSDAVICVCMARVDDGERWTRQFGSSSFSSVLRRPDESVCGVLFERLGFVELRFQISASHGQLAMAVEAARLWGIPLPTVLVPICHATEFVDAQGRFRFEVDIGVPLAGRIVCYQGWLKPVPDPLDAG